MTGPVHRNVSFATAGGLTDLLNVGTSVEVRGSHVRELRNHLTILQQPRERCLFLPYRGNDVTASIAETLWVLAGRDDVEWLSTYLPRAPDFSDDGTTWRGAYGPRLRNWNGVDQLAESRRLLLEDGSTRRAVMSLYDPGRDFVQSRDIPCNNWLHWLLRDGRLHLTIAVRSNDVVWGFSGVNCFEWSVLQDMMAFWIGAELGDATYLASSFHLYDRHEERARRIVAAFNGVSCYDFDLDAPSFRTQFDQLDDVLKVWFDLEAEVRADPESEIEAERRLQDPFLAISLEIIRVYHGVNRGWSVGRLSEELARLPSCDLAAAAYEFYIRQYPALIELIPDSRIGRFMRAYRTDTQRGPVADSLGIINAIKRLHAQKNAAYGTAWKRRGELTSIVANIARKVDRLEHHISTGAEPGSETIFDTAVDLFVYLIKYRLFLSEHASTAIVAAEFPKLQATFSEDPVAFDLLVDRYAKVQLSARSTQAIALEIVASFDRLHSLAADANTSVTQRLEEASRSANLAFELVFALARERPTVVQTLMS